MTRRYFGTDGIRGTVGQSPITPDFMLRLGHAVGRVLKRSEQRPTVLIGKDTRISGYMIESALEAGFTSAGVDVLMTGPLPTPGVAYLTRALRLNLGVVISASHNPFGDNGIKFFDSEGFKLADAWEEEMERLVHRNVFTDVLPRDDAIGRNTKVVDADGRYIEFVKATFPRKISLKSLSIVLDCANGAGYRTAPLVLRELDAKVFPYGVSPNGLNINAGCGSIHPEEVQKAVIEHRADVGIALDGDADRVVMVAENAQVIDGDTILAICARDMQRRGCLKNNRVVGTVMSNLGFLQAMESLGIEVFLSPVGDRYVIQEMLRQEANLGGEQSGHVIFLDHNTTGDGLVCALQVLRIMIETDSKLSELAAFVQRFPQICLSVRVKAKPPLESLEIVQGQIRQAEQALGSTGRVLVRYSGTEEICRVMVEGANGKQVGQLAQAIAVSVRQAIG